jgi:hypothetical protein
MRRKNNFGQQNVLLYVFAPTFIEWTSEIMELF